VDELPAEISPYYQGGNVTIYHGDCRDVLPHLSKVQLVITDPPYSLGAANGEWEATAAVAIGIHEAAKLVGDGGAMLAFTTSSGRGLRFTLGAVGKLLPLNRLLTWHKTGGGSYAAGPWHWDTIQIMAFGRATFGPARASSMFVTEAKYPKETKHRAELPPGIADWLYGPFDAEDVTVLDPFCGTGRLLEPAVKSGRQVVGIEIEERYCELAAKRLARLAPSALSVEVARGPKAR
jgi:site-specific DNA-methyltransferase (adenine-specific)